MHLHRTGRHGAHSGICSGSTAYLRLRPVETWVVAYSYFRTGLAKSIVGFCHDSCRRTLKDGCLGFFLAWLFPLTGRILDNSPGLVGHQHYFMFLGGVAATGILVVAWLVWLNRR